MYNLFLEQTAQYLIYTAIISFAGILACYRYRNSIFLKYGSLIGGKIGSTRIDQFSLINLLICGNWFCFPFCFALCNETTCDHISIAHNTISIAYVSLKISWHTPVHRCDIWLYALDNLRTTFYSNTKLNTKLLLYHQSMYYFLLLKFVLQF